MRMRSKHVILRRLHGWGVALSRMPLTTGSAPSCRNRSGIRPGGRYWKLNLWFILLFLIGQQVRLASLTAQAVSVPAADSFSGKPRVAIISDMGNEPDDQMSFVRL